MFRSSQLELQLPVSESVSESGRGEERKRREEKKNQTEKVCTKDISTTDRRDRENWCLPS